MRSFSTSAKSLTKSFDIVICGAGSGGLAAGAHLAKKYNVCFVEPSEWHHYQPGWTMVGGGLVGKNSTTKSMDELMPKKASWLKHGVQEFKPDENQIVLDNGEAVEYKSLIVAVGNQINWTQVEGLSKEDLGENGICSIYDLEASEKTWHMIQNLKKGNALFTFNPAPKCPGAPQKIMYLAADHW